MRQSLYFVALGLLASSLPASHAVAQASRAARPNANGDFPAHVEIRVKQRLQRESMKLGGVTGDAKGRVARSWAFSLSDDYLNAANEMRQASKLTSNRYVAEMARQTTQAAHAQATTPFKKISSGLGAIWAGFDRQCPVGMFLQASDYARMRHAPSTWMKKVESAVHEHRACMIKVIDGRRTREATLRAQFKAQLPLYGRALDIYIANCRKLMSFHDECSRIERAAQIERVTAANALAKPARDANWTARAAANSRVLINAEAERIRQQNRG